MSHYRFLAYRKVSGPKHSFYVNDELGQPVSVCGKGNAADYAAYLSRMYGLEYQVTAVLERHLPWRDLVNEYRGPRS